MTLLQQTRAEVTQCPQALSCWCQHHACHTDLGYEDGVDFGVVLEVLQNLHPFSLGGGSIDVGSGEGQGVSGRAQSSSPQRLVRGKRLLPSPCPQEALLCRRLRRPTEGSAGTPPHPTPPCPQSCQVTVPSEVPSVPPLPWTVLFPAPSSVPTGGAPVPRGPGAAAEQMLLPGGGGAKPLETSPHRPIALSSERFSLTPCSAQGHDPTCRRWALAMPLLLLWKDPVSVAPQGWAVTVIMTMTRTGARCTGPAHINSVLC